MVEVDIVTTAGVNRDVMSTSELILIVVSVAAGVTVIVEWSVEVTEDVTVDARV